MDAKERLVPRPLTNSCLAERCLGLLHQGVEMRPARGPARSAIILRSMAMPALLDAGEWTANR
jgi:hypothetical protein